MFCPGSGDLKWKMRHDDASGLACRACRAFPVCEGVEKKQPKYYDLQHSAKSPDVSIFLLGTVGASSLVMTPQFLRSDWLWRQLWSAPPSNDD